nr:c-type cytochrome [Sulfurimonas sp. SAG-AH-194-I05]
MDTYQEGKALYASCVGCHGSKGEKKALGKSAVIEGWSSQEVVTALHGYKDGSYGGAMKALMKGQVTKLSEADIKALADYISTL